MKKRLISTLLVLCMVLGILPGTAAATEQTDTWDGVSVDTDWYTSNKNATTFTISTAAQLAGLAELVNNDITRFDNKTITLDRDIDLNGHQWTSIGSKETSYGYWGNFNGNNHTITNLAINITDDYGGIFGKISRGTVENLSVSGIVSTSHNSSTITVYPVGGIVASTSESSAIQNCSFSGEVSGYASVGGIVGSNSRGIVRKCSNSGSVTAELQRSGGIVGSNFGTIELCCNTGPVSTVPQEATGGSVGGISGDSLGNIIQCYNTGNVQGTHSTGGIVGMAERGTVISDSYNVGTVSINKYQSGCGGIVGYVDDLLTVENCYNVGTLNGGSISVGGIIGNGKNKSSISNCFYLSQEGISLEEAISRSDFATQDTFVGWDFDTIWEMSDELHRPVLRNCSENSAGGDIPIDPPEPVNPKIISLYPANRSTFDHTSTSGNKAFHITFDREVSNAGGNRPQLDFSVGTLEVHKASDDSVVYQVTESPFTSGASSDVSLYGSSAPYTAISITGITPELNHDTEYYVTMPAGFIKMADGTRSSAIEKGEWMLKTANQSVPEKPTTQPMVVNQTGNFKFNSDILTGRDDKNIRYDYNYDESWFLQNSTVYQHDLVKMSIRIALAAGGAKGERFDGEEIVPYSSANIKSLMTDLGYTNFYDAYVEPEYNTIGYAISSKNVQAEDGDEFSIIMVAIRGAGYFQEWGGDFNVGMTKEHDGFRLAANEVMRGLREYLSDYENALLDTKKIWITGFSRGAATTNLVAARLNDGWIDEIEQKNIYAFCFACPQNIDNSKKANVADPTKKEDLISNYTNIVNIVNPIDAIPKVAMSASGWEFSRYGMTYYLPALGVTNRSAYQPLAERMEKEYQAILKPYPNIQAETYIPEKVDAAYLRDWLADILAFIFIMPEYYVDNVQNFLMSTAANALGAESDTNMAINLKIFANRLKQVEPYIKDSRISALVTATAYMADEAAEIMFSHYGELYLSWLDSLNGVSDYTKNPKYRIVYINCPVDVEIYDEHGILVGQIKDDGIVNITNDIGVLTDENDQKIVILPFDAEYTIQLTATDRGEVTYTVVERSIESGGVEKVVSYYQVDVELGEQLIGTVENLDTTAVADYPLIINNDSITPTVVQNGDDLSLREVSVLSNGRGIVNGGGYYISGEYAKVTATADEGETFLGWYVDNTLVSAKAEYKFLVDRDVSITAAFTQNTPDVPITPTPFYPAGDNIGKDPTPAAYSITIPSFIGGTVTTSPKSASKGATVTLTATPDKGYELSSLAVTDSKGNELDLTDKGDSKYTFVMPASAVTVNAVFKKAEPAETAPVDETYLFPFTDVLRADWFYDAVEYAFNKDLMNGIAPYTFDPQGKMTRAMVWTVLGRMADADVDGSDSPWYAKAQTWATVNNVSDGTNPTGNVSRQELTTMLWRYIGSPAATADLSKFSDSESVADWADGAMQWAVSTGLIVGDDGRLNPNGDAKRCEVATLFMRFCETISE